jgi:hypothetical protein
MATLRLTRKIWVIVINAALVLFILSTLIFGILGQRSFARELTHYGVTPSPAASDLIDTLRMKVFDLVMVLLLVCGALAEFRSRGVATLVNPLVYTTLIAVSTWETASASRGKDFILWIVLASEVPFLLVPSIGLALYRREIRGLFNLRGTSAK